MSTKGVTRATVDRAAYYGGARSRFIAAVTRLAAEVRQGRSPSECWREVDRAIEELNRRRPGRQG